MYSKNSNPQAMESRRMIKEALLTLMEKSPYDEITITQICQEARVVRQTYYRNFENKDDIIYYHLDQIYRTYFEKYYFTDDVDRQLESFFDYMYMNKVFLSLISQNKMIAMLEKTISKDITLFISIEKLTDDADSSSEKYVKGFIASTVCSLLSIWVQSGFQESSAVMKEITKTFLSGLYGA